MHSFIHRAIALASKSSAAMVAAASAPAPASHHLAPRALAAGFITLPAPLLSRLAPFQPRLALVPCPVHVPSRTFPSRRHFASETAPDEQQRKLAELAIKLQQSPDFLLAVNDLNSALLAKGLQPDELNKPSLKLFSALMDRDVKAKVEAIAVALKKSGITDEEIKNAAAMFAGSGLFSGAPGSPAAGQGEGGKNGSGDS